MPNIGSVLRDEIRRLARKETKAAVVPLRKLTYQLLRRIAQQKRRIAELEQATKRGARVVAREPAGAAESGPQARFSAKWMRRHRKKLGMSRQAYAKLLGVSAQSVMGWEGGSKRPRRATIDAWRRLREMGIRETKAMLSSGESLGGEPKRRARRRKGRKRARRVVAGAKARRMRGRARRPARAGAGRRPAGRMKRRTGGRAKRRTRR